MRFKASWLIPAVLGILLVLAQRVLWFSHDGFPADAALKRAISRQIQHNRRLNRLNRRLYSEVSSLEKGTGAVAQHARTDLDFVKPGETFFAVVDARQQPRRCREEQGARTEKACRSRFPSTR